MKRKLALLLAAIIAVSYAAESAYALQPASSTSFKARYAAMPAGATNLGSTSFKARASRVGQTGKPQQTSLPVSVTVFQVE